MFRQHHSKNIGPQATYYVKIANKIYISNSLKCNWQPKCLHSLVYDTACYIVDVQHVHTSHPMPPLDCHLFDIIAQHTCPQYTWNLSM